MYALQAASLSSNNCGSLQIVSLLFHLAFAVTATSLKAALTDLRCPSRGVRATLDIAYREVHMCSDLSSSLSHKQNHKRLKYMMYINKMNGGIWL